MSDKMDDEDKSEPISFQQRSSQRASIETQAAVSAKRIYEAILERPKGITPVQMARILSRMFERYDFKKEYDYDTIEEFAIELYNSRDEPIVTARRFASVAANNAQADDAKSQESLVNQMTDLIYCAQDTPDAWEYEFSEVHAMEIITSGIYGVSLYPVLATALATISNHRELKKINNNEQLKAFEQVYPLESLIAQAINNAWRQHYGKNRVR